MNNLEEPITIATTTTSMMVTKHQGCGHAYTLMLLAVHFRDGNRMRLRIDIANQTSSILKLYIPLRNEWRFMTNLPPKYISAKNDCNRIRLQVHL